jgi:hypothetical protein
MEVFKMNRAEMRRMNKKNNKKTKTYTLTEAQIDKLRTDTVRRAVDVSRALMMAIPCNVLGHCYWEKTAKKRMMKFMAECESLYESMEAGTISLNELLQDTAELCGIGSEYFDRLKEDRLMWERMNMGE